MVAWRPIGALGSVLAPLAPGWLAQRHRRLTLCSVALSAPPPRVINPVCRLGQSRIASCVPGTWQELRTRTMLLPRCPRRCQVGPFRSVDVGGSRAALVCPSGRRDSTGQAAPQTRAARWMQRLVAALHTHCHGLCLCVCVCALVIHGRIWCGCRRLAPALPRLPIMSTSVPSIPERSQHVRREAGYELLAMSPCSIAFPMPTP